MYLVTRGEYHLYDVNDGSNYYFLLELRVRRSVLRPFNEDIEIMGSSKAVVLMLEYWLL